MPTTCRKSGMATTKKQLYPSLTDKESPQNLISLKTYTFFMWIDSMGECEGSPGKHKGHSSFLTDH